LEVVILDSSAHVVSDSGIRRRCRRGRSFGMFFRPFHNKISCFYL